jgi:hypothetical protein
MNKEINYEIFDKNIFVYKNLITDPNKFVEVLNFAEKNPKESQIFGNWSPWSFFGTYMDAHRLPISEKDIIDKKRYETEVFYRDQVLDAFKISTSHFLKKHGLSVQKDWIEMGPSFCRYNQDIYNDDSNPESPLTMLYHTDYRFAEFDAPWPQFALTCTMYLNDDYEGGDVLFKIMGSDEIKPYKPKAGDVMVFPSGHPKLLSEDGVYFHAVKTITKKDKYFIRYFYLLPNNASDKWLELEKQYGKEEWAKKYHSIVENRRIKGISHVDSQLR